MADKKELFILSAEDVKSVVEEQGLPMPDLSDERQCDALYDELNDRIDWHEAMANALRVVAGMDFPALRGKDIETVRTFDGLVHCATMMIMAATSVEAVNEVRDKLSNASGRLVERSRQLDPDGQKE